MSIKQIDKTTVSLEVDGNFDLRHTFLCGQCFRWYENDDGSFSGVAYGKAVKMELHDKELIIHNTSVDDAEKIWINYLDLNRDYSHIKGLYAQDEYVSKAMEFGYGIHILNQDIFECLISFIISTQNQIPRIKKIVAQLSQMYGTKQNLQGETLYAFPTLTQLDGIRKSDLDELKAGYRADYIVNAIGKLTTGEVDLEKVRMLPYLEAKNELMKIKGVGPKVADCVLLFSAGKSEAFPIDVWVKRTMQTLYLDDKASIKEIEAKAKTLFGEYAGFAQQYLFYYARENGGF